jgi:hypothetical protein
MNFRNQAEVVPIGKFWRLHNTRPSSGSRVVEPSPYHAKVGGSSPAAAAGTGRRENGKKVKHFE